MLEREGELLEGRSPAQGTVPRPKADSDSIDPEKVHVRIKAGTEELEDLTSVPSILVGGSQLLLTTVPGDTLLSSGLPGTACPWTWVWSVLLKKKSIRIIVTRESLRKGEIMHLRKSSV